MDAITAIEDALVIETLSRAIDSNGVSVLKKADHLPGPMNVTMLKQLSAVSPGVYWSFLGGRAKDVESEVQLISNWMMYVITSHASGNAARRRGDGSKLGAGAYEIMTTLIPHINAFVVPNVGSMKFKQARNLYSGEFEKKSVALYVASFELLMSLPIPVDSTLEDFLTFHVDYDIPTQETLAEHNKWLLDPPDFETSEPDAQSDTTLEQ